MSTKSSSICPIRRRNAARSRVITDAARPRLRVAGLAKAIGGRTLFAGVSLTLEPGAFVAIMGESGVGKSTLLNVIAGLDRGDVGSIAVDGADLAPLGDAARTRLRRERIGFVFQAFHILPHLSLARNVALPLVLLGMSGTEATARAARLLDEVGLGGRGGDYPRQLSGGELQRVAIARAIVHRPALILADEPTGNLDPETAGRIMTLLARQVRETGAAALLVTHSADVAAVADRVLRLSTDGLAPA